MDLKQIRMDVFKEENVKLDKYIDELWENDDLKYYHFFSANIMRFFPIYDEAQIKKAYFELLSYRILQSIDTQIYQSFENFKDIEIFYNKINVPSIYISFHIGSYRTLLAILVKKKINLVLIVDPLAYKLQKDEIFEKFEKVKNYFKSTSTLLILSADQKDLSLELLKRTKKGDSILAFIDGNNGYNGAFNQKQSLEINFLSQNIFIRTGLAKLSYIMKLPIVPIISFYDNYEQNWEFCDSITPQNNINLEAYISKTINNLYSILEVKVRKNPFQWDGWLYIHKFMNIKFENNTFNLEFKKDDIFFKNKNIGLFSYEDKYYVLNKSNYKIYELNKMLFDLLKKTENNHKIDSTQISDEDLKSLFITKIIRNNEENI